ncbi:hypothetical protein BGX38DRAFT_806332, partial [Terfezia claveryi]
MTFSLHHSILYLLKPFAGSWLSMKCQLECGGMAFIPSSSYFGIDYQILVRAHADLHLPRILYNGPVVRDSSCIRGHQNRAFGGLGRYRMAKEDDDVRDREVWTNVASSWYSKAADKKPTVGRLYHHIAILERPNVLQQLFFYCKSLTVGNHSRRR